MYDDATIQATLNNLKTLADSNKIFIINYIRDVNKYTNFFKELNTLDPTKSTFKIVNLFFYDISSDTSANQGIKDSFFFSTYFHVFPQDQNTNTKLLQLTGGTQPTIYQEAMLVVSAKCFELYGRHRTTNPKTLKSFVYRNIVKLCSK